MPSVVRISNMSLRHQLLGYLTGPVTSVVRMSSRSL